VAHAQAMFTAIIRQHQALGTPVTAATLSRIRATLRAALNAAVRRGLIADNPASRAELPTARRARAVVWTPARTEHWRRTGEHPPARCGRPCRPLSSSASEDHRLYAAYRLIALRGLRRGETAGLRWCDLDLNGKTGCHLAPTLRQSRRQRDRLASYGVAAPQTKKGLERAAAHEGRA
jgi:integrase